MFDDKNKSESLYHAALIYSKKIGIGNNSANEKLRDWLKDYGTFEKIYSNLYEGNDVKGSLMKINGLENVIKKLNGIDFDFKVLTINDIDFPEHLKKVEEATPVIYTRGDLNLFNRKSMGVVGTRFIFPNKDRQAYDEANNVMKRLMVADFVIVSGLAEGCDTIAHIHAIEHGGSTIAVLGTPLDKYYPASNKDMQEKIAKEHLLISQYPIGIKSFEHFFANRNLTTVSLSTDGIVVIKASDNSGTMHAVRHCIEQNKPLYVLENNFSKPHRWLEEYKDKIKKVTVK